MSDPGSVLLVHGPSTGGIRRHVGALANGLVARGWKVRIAGPDGGRAIDQRGIDIVHAHGLAMGWAASLIPRHKPLVVTVHNVVLDEVAGPRAATLRRLEARLPTRADAVIAASPAVAAALGGADDGKVRVLRPVGPPAVPRHPPDVVRAALGVNADTPLVVAVGRLHRQKGFDTLLDAVPAIAAAVPPVRIVVVGEGPEEVRLRRRIVTERLAPPVVLAGPSANAADELAAADVVVVSSIWESGPFVLAEAMELGRPVVTTPVGFAPALVDDGSTGQVVPVGDAPALAVAVTELLEEPERAARLARAGQGRVAAWLDRDGLIDQVVAIYRATLDRR